MAMLGACLLLPLLLGACAGSRDNTRETAPTPEAEFTQAVGNPQYRIGPSDLLTVTVFQVKDLDREVRVDDDGMISLPLIGAVQAGGHTPAELERTIAGLYGASYLQDPQVSIFLKEFTSLHVTVSGAVEKPGIYPISSQMTLLQAIATAEGFGELASHDNVFVLRTIDGQRQFARFNVDDIEKGQLDDPVLRAEDVVIVDTSVGKQSLKVLIQLAPYVGLWRSYNYNR